MKTTQTLRRRLKSRISLVSVIGLVLALMAAFILHSHSVGERKARRAMLPRLLPTVQTHDLGGSSTLTLFVPNHSKKTIVIAVPINNDLGTKRLRKLSFDASATILKVELPTADCLQALRLFDESLRRFAPSADIVVGLDQEAILAQRWLSLQNNEQAIAVSLTTDGIGAPARDVCAGPATVLPSKGTWHNITSNKLTVWENGVATDVTTPITPRTLISEELETYLRHEILNIPELNMLNKLPLIELPAANYSDTLTIFYSGDGGWRGLDKHVSERMADIGISVVGVDALDYYWDFKSPEKSAAELSELMEHYRQVWGIKHFVIAGYSFGADILPALYNRLPATDQADITSIMLLSFARSANFEIRIEGMIGKDAGKYLTAPEMAQLPADKVFCVYGTDEAHKSGCTDTRVVGKALGIPGNHHFNDDYDTVSTHLIDFIRRSSEG
ncbi:virulence factor family protein [Pseudomonas sp. LP_7_YM]|uniref:virulence factor family protein n=1 Tax=Pseudomonas sp. LP_7_YM TaxID=2485137 RepID=UPI00105B874B|nr:AcvB/VirJ family lysyl-phosphatidylglycerol hydrolase [Pseudomonas sp. LP_7_YM]TDV64305.1 virulence protein VirJ [Pseudomonas sp. LP_7_YM]